MLALESRGKGVDTVLLTLTRGEGGQNRTGSILYDELGTLRTLELLASDKVYGVKQRFTRVADFGYSRSAKETFAKWQGHDVALGDMVRVIRTFRPDVIVSRFAGTPADGHGQHQATGILTKEAFRAAADPTKFPEQIEAGLQPWQAKKLYVSIRAGEDYTVALDMSATDPDVGKSYAQIGLEGLRYQESQGAGASGARRTMRYYKLVDSAIPATVEPGGYESGFFDGIDTSWRGLAADLGADQNKVPGLRDELTVIGQKVREADMAAEKNPEAAFGPLLAGSEELASLEERLKQAEIESPGVGAIRRALDEKAKEFDEALRLAAGVDVEATFDDSTATPKTAGMVVPGQTFTAVVRVKSSSKMPMAVESVTPQSPGGWQFAMEGAPADAMKPEGLKFVITVPATAEYTRPYFHRDDPATETIYHLDDPHYVTLPFIPPPVHFTVHYRIAGFERTAAMAATLNAEFKNSDGKESRRPVVVAPAASVETSDMVRVMPASTNGPVEFQVTVHSYVAHLHDAVVTLHAPDGWTVEPTGQPVNLDGKGASRTFKFYLFRLTAGLGRAELRAQVRFNGQDYDQAVTILTRDGLGTGYYYAASVQPVSVVDVKFPHNAIYGYIMGAGDEIPQVLRDIGMDLRMITPEELASGDLSKYATIVLGVRAYDVRPDVRKYNARLLHFVDRGGTLVVQYNANIAEFNAGHYMPFMAELGNERVTDEDAPMTMLDPDDDVFDWPNALTTADFNGWVQERGLNFMHSWEGIYETPLESGDPGEPPLKGGLLRGTYGRGTYIYCAYSFFRQMPAGVPGAVRLFVNIMTSPNEWRH